jgi:hypothetical protein
MRAITPLYIKRRMSVIMLNTARQERIARIAKLHADLSRSQQIMDQLGLDIAANYLDLAMAKIEPEVHQKSDIVTFDTVADATFPA